MIKDLGLKEPYVGVIPLVSGEIAEDVAQYYAVSEQIPTVCGLGVLVNPDLTVRAAGGFLVQLLPFAGESVISAIEKNVAALPPISSLLESGAAPAEIAHRLLDGLSPEELDTAEPVYRCDCSRERTERILISLGKKEIESIISDGEDITVSCHFCGRKYVFGQEDMRSLLKRAVDIDT